MFGAVDMFAKAFTPVEGGYLYYPSARSGAKFVSNDEFEILIADWQKIAGMKGIFKAVGLIVLVILISTLAGAFLGLPDWAVRACSMLCIPLFVFWLFRAVLSPRRMVRDRPDAAPPRKKQQVRKDARNALTWRMIIFCLLFSASIFFSTVFSEGRAQSDWAWIIVSGAMLVCYLWLAIRKLGDQYR